jgi:hypothetical protein
MKHPLRSSIILHLGSLALILAVLLPASLHAQKKDNLGKEFYMAFAENQGGQTFNPPEDLNFFALYITSKVPANVTVEVKGLGFLQKIVTTPGKISTVELPDGKNFGDPTLEISTDEQVVSGMSVHVTSDEEIAVYGINSKQYSTDAFMALPIDVLGTEYRTMNYQSSSLGNTPGEFWIVAVSDSTNITITPKATTANGINAGTPIKVLLYTGDVYLVQGFASDPNNDLTGSLIESDQPISVFSGHVRTQIPFDAVNSDTHQPSRNHLVEQLPPVSAWGDSALVVRFASATQNDLVRVVSSEDGNKITKNGQAVATLNAGDFYEITSLTGPTSIQGTSPILVGQFLHTSQYGTGGNRSYGDPSYALVFPVEQFDTAYTFIEAERDLFKRNFLNIVADPAGISTIVINGPNGIKIVPTGFQPIPGSSYLYSQVEVPKGSAGQGSYTISGTKPFGITVYAMGPADAYAYTGGSLLKTITPFKTVNLVIDFGDRVMTGELTPPPAYTFAKNYWDTTVYLQNISSDPYVVNGFATRTGDPDNFLVTKPVTPPSYSIGPGVIDSMTIRFQTIDPGVRKHTKINAVTEHLRAYVVDVYGRGILPTAETFSDSLAKKYIDTLDFGIFDWQVDGPKDSFVFVMNKGMKDLFINSESITGPNAADFSIKSTTIKSRPVLGFPYTLHPYNLLALNDSAAMITVTFTPGKPNGMRQAVLEINAQGTIRKVVLLAQIRTILKSTITPATFDTAFICQEQVRSIFIDNPNDFPITLKDLRINGANAGDFTPIIQIPLVIDPNSRTEIKVTFAPSNITGQRSATATLDFDLPKGYSQTFPLSGYGDQLSSSFRTRKSIHILPGEETVFPIYALTPMEKFQSPSLELDLNYDPTYIEDFDFMQDNTLTSLGEWDVYNDSAGSSRYLYHDLYGGVVTGGSDTTQMPIVYIKFRSHIGEGDDPAHFHRDIDINYKITFDRSPVPSGCILALAPTGMITLDSTCENIHLLQDTLLYPNESYIEPIRPNPVSSHATVTFDVPTLGHAVPLSPVRLEIVDMLGNKAATLVDDMRKPGTYKASWNATGVQPGVYTVCLITAGKVKTRQMVIVR